MLQAKVVIDPLERYISILYGYFSELFLLCKVHNDKVQM